MYSKNVTIEFWDWNCCGPHEYIARGIKPLIEIATGNVSVTMRVERMVKGKRRMELQSVGQVTCTLVFQVRKMLASFAQILFSPFDP